jgi:hypothetical protein
MKLKPEVKEKWLAALRSGEYNQGRRQLRTSDGNYCCIGVLCDISGLGEWVDDAGYGSNYKTEDGLSWATAPAVVRAWATRDGEDSDSVWDDLVGLNDLSSLSFEEIAMYIEEDL